MLLLYNYATGFNVFTAGRVFTTSEVGVLDNVGFTPFPPVVSKSMAPLMHIVPGATAPILTGDPLTHCAQVYPIPVHMMPPEPLQLPAETGVDGVTGLFGETTTGAVVGALEGATTATVVVGTTTGVLTSPDPTGLEEVAPHVPTRPAPKLPLTEDDPAEYEPPY